MVCSGLSFRSFDPCREGAVTDSTATSRPTTRSSPQNVELLQNYIGGRWVAARTDRYLDVYNPAAGEVIARTPLSGPEDVDAAVNAASRAFRGWWETPVVVRARAMFRF